MVFDRRLIIAGVAALIALPGPVMAGDLKVIDAFTAYEKSKAGDLLIIDVRSPGEWQATGIPAGAKAVTIHDRDGLRGFATKMYQTIGDNPDRPVALICATGNRSTRAGEVLQRIGYTNIYNIKEGMMGRNVAAKPDQKGWIKHGLPLDKVK